MFGGDKQGFNIDLWTLPQFIDGLKKMRGHVFSPCGFFDTLRGKNTEPTRGILGGKNAIVSWDSWHVYILIGLCHQHPPGL